MQIPFISRLLSSLEVNVNGFAVCEVQRGFSLELNGMKAPIIHYVLKGSGTLKMDDGVQVHLAPHDFVLLPPGRKHWVDVPDGSPSHVRGMEHCVALVDAMLRISANRERAADLVTTCGMIEATYAGSLGAFDNLSTPIALHLREGSHLRQAVDALLGELADPRLGTHTLTEALLKQCLVLLVRELSADPLRVQELFGTVSPRLLKPVLAMVEHPASDFTLDSLAALAGMSRSGFTAQFHAAFGQAPIEFLRSIRLRRAARLLERTDLPVALIAKSIGYDSRTYFSRAFRAEFDIDPRGFRARRRRIPV